MSQKAEVVLSLKDNFSETLRKAKETQEKFTKDLEGMQKRLDEINRTKATIKIDADEAKRELNNAKKAYEEFNDELHKDALIEAQQRFDTFNDSLKETTRQANNVKRAMQELVAEESKVGNHAGSTGSSEGGADGGAEESSDVSLKTVGATILSSKLFSQVKDAVSGYLSTSIRSAYGAAVGDTVENLASGVLGGVGSGAGIGAFFGGPIGAAIGAGIGGLVGLFTGSLKDSSQKQADRDSLFQNTVQGIYDEVLEMRQDMLTEGSLIAAQRESNLTAFSTLLRDEAGRYSFMPDSEFGMFGANNYTAVDAAGWGRIDPKVYAQDFLDSIVAFSRKTPFGYDELTSISKTLLTYGYKSEDIIPMLTKIGDAGAALGWDSSAKVSVATYLGRMSMSDRVTMQYLNPLIAQGINVIDYIRQSLEPALGELSNADVMDMVSKGELSGEAVSKVILEYMGADFQGSMDELQHSYDGLQSTLEDWEGEMQAAMGRGFNEARKPQMEQQIQWYEDHAEELEEMYEAVGVYEANLIGTKEQTMRDKFDELLHQYKDGPASPGEMSQALYEAIIDAKVEYFDTDAYQSLYSSQQELVNRIQQDLAQSHYDCGYALGQEFTKGYKSAVETATDIFESLFNDPYVRLALGQLGIHINSSSNGEYAGSGGKYAYGIQSVPYDDYPALLHAGERVMTAAQARAADQSPGGSVMITGNTFVVRQESDIEAIAEALYAKLAEASAVYVGG